ncbi:MAG: hypothetical protein ABIB71_06840 [Candidatus Woesearchaeota archaeon]
MVKINKLQDIISRMNSSLNLALGKFKKENKGVKCGAYKQHLDMIVSEWNTEDILRCMHKKDKQHTAQRIAENMESIECMDPDMRSHSLYNAGLITLYIGGIEEAKELFVEALAFADKEDDIMHYHHLEFLYNNAESIRDILESAVKDYASNYDIGSDIRYLEDAHQIEDFDEMRRLPLLDYGKAN